MSPYPKPRIHSPIPFGVVEEKLEQAESETLATKFDNVKMFLPTRTHPGNADVQPWATVSALMLAPIDRLRDLFEARQFATEQEKSAAAARS